MTHVCVQNDTIILGNPLHEEATEKIRLSPKNPLKKWYSAWTNLLLIFIPPCTILKMCRFKDAVLLVMIFSNRRDKEV